MWGRRPHAPAKGTSPFGIPETFHFARAGAMRRRPRQCQMIQALCGAQYRLS